ncbi:protein YgfX [Thiofaba sp. EF100]|uniref:protein YgfX n=1 Tax=Thiofaba sp. EF100 TaxID=3121274 RepID=UPI003221AE3B
MRKHSPILLLKPRRSPTLVVAILLVHGLGVLALGLSALPGPAAFGLSLTLAASAVLALRGMLPVREMQWGDGATWHLILANGQVRRALLDVQASRSLPWWVSLAFRLEDGGRLHVPLPRDALPPDDFRRLRVRLRVEAGALVGGPPPGR